MQQKYHTTEQMIFSQPCLLKGISEAYGVLTAMLKEDAEPSHDDLYKITFDSIAFQYAEQGDWIATIGYHVKKYPDIIVKCASMVIGLYQCINCFYEHSRNDDLTLCLPGILKDSHGRILEFATNVPEGKKNGYLSYINDNPEIEAYIRKRLKADPSIHRILLDLTNRKVYAEYLMNDEEESRYPMDADTDEWFDIHAELTSCSTAD